MYNLNPKGYTTYSGKQVPVILCHKDSYNLGLGSAHGDVYHWFNRYGKTMDDVRNDVAKIMNSTTKPSTSSTATTKPPVQPTTNNYTQIMGTSVATAAQMQAYIKTVNPSVAQSVIDMIPLYLSEGKGEGVRGDIAFAQSCLETGNFKFAGSAVTLDQNNFCGLGVTSNGMKGNSFSSPQLGIRAQIQHLKAYASTENLVNSCIDPRFKYVTRGCAPYVEYLGIQENPAGKGWAAGAGYGSKILTILKNIIGTKVSTSATTPTAKLYRVCTSYNNGKYVGQIGAYRNFNYAKAACKTGYWIYDEQGYCVWPYNTGYNKTYTVTASSGLNVRSGPGTNHSIKTAIGYGSKVTCYGWYQVATDNSIWLYIATADGTKGYVSMKYLK